MNSLPNNPEAEQGVLGCLLLDSSLIPFAVERLNRAHEPFYDFRHASLLYHLEAMHKDGGPVEPIILQQRLKDAAALEQLGGMPYIAGLMNCVPSATNLEYYIDIVIDLAIRRRRIEAATMLEKAERLGNSEARDEALRMLAELSKEKIPELDIETRRFNPLLNPPPIVPVYTMAGAVISTPGNLQTINAHAKAGKSGLINALLAAPMATAGSDTLQIVAENPHGRAVVHFDTEQSIEDHWHQVSRALRRAGRETVPDWLLSYCLTGFDSKKTRAAVWMRVESAAQQFGGIHSILIDGVADLVSDVNDPEECNAFVADLHALAIKYACPISGVIHFNPGSEKTRGHLGSQLERKAETNLRVDKDGEVSSVWSEKQRRAPIPKGKGPRFQWSDEAKMHVTVATGLSAKEIAKREDAICVRDDVFNGRPSMRYSDLEKAIRDTTGKSETGAKRIFREWGQFQIIEKTFAGLWIPKS